MPTKTVLEREWKANLEELRDLKVGSLVEVRDERELPLARVGIPAGTELYRSRFNHFYWLYPRGHRMEEV